MFDKLIRLYSTYSAAKLTKPYNPVLIQGWGMAFADEWNARKLDICAHFGVEEKDMDYLKYPTYMPLLCRNG